MRLVVLGSGTCTPGPRASSGYWVEAGPARLRLDCGAGTVHAMGRFGVDWEALTHQFVSHFHIDHCAELPALLFALKYARRAPRTAPLALVGPAGLAGLVERLAAALDPRIVQQEFPVSIVELAPAGAIDLGDGATLRVAKTPHTTESLCVRIEHRGRSLGYTGDTAPSDEVADFFAGVDALVCEVSFLDHDRNTPHLTAPQAAALAARAGVGKLVATHCYFDPEAERLGDLLARGFGGEILVARDGDSVVLA
jgi:ribonuclease BN (tRNA processing enzyme)